MKPDRRIERTREAITTAFLTLAVEKGYEQVSVQNIVGRANIGRTTFYAHYSDKEDLLDNVLNSLFLHIGEMLNIEGNNIAPARALFEHVDSHAHLQKAFDFNLISSKFQVEVTHIVRQQLAKKSPSNTSKQLLDMKAEVISGGLISLLKWWLKAGKPYSAEKLDSTFHEMFSYDDQIHCGVGR